MWEPLESLLVDCGRLGPFLFDWSKVLVYHREKEQSLGFAQARHVLVECRRAALLGSLLCWAWYHCNPARDQASQETWVHHRSTRIYEGWEGCCTHLPVSVELQ